MNSKLLCIIMLAFTVMSHQRALGQMQLVLLKHERVLLRLSPGDDFVYRLKNSKTIKSSYVNNLSDTAVVTHSDVVPFHTIDRIYFRRLTFYNKAGAYMVAGGLLLFLADQINVSLVQGNKPNLDGGISTVTLTMIGAGLPMAIIKKKSQRLKYKYRLMMVKEGSPFYRDFN